MNAPKSTRSLAATVVLALATVSAAQPRNEGEKKAGAPASAVAIVGGVAITDAELEEFVKEKLAPLRAQAENIKRQALEQYINKRLAEGEAKARGIAVPDLEKAEIDEKVMPVTDEQKRAVYETVPGNFTGKSEAEAFAQIQANLTKVRLAEGRKRFYAELRKQAGVKLLLSPPPIVKAVNDTGEHPAFGPKDAPVQLVEFSDFQCPYCQRSAQVLKRLKEKYPSQLRVVFRDFPLSFHQQAAKAAEAGWCAHEQGRFWEYHDKLFANQRALHVPELKQTAQQLGLDGGSFAQCLDSGKYEAKLQQGLADGQKLGVRGTPAMFVNGRFVNGAKPFEEMVQIVEEELAKKGSGFPESSAGVIEREPRRAAAASR